MKLCTEINALRAGVRRVALALADSDVLISPNERGLLTKTSSAAVINKMTKRLRGSFDMKRDFDTVRRIAFEIRKARETKAAKCAGYSRNRSPMASHRASFARHLTQTITARIAILRREALLDAAKATLRYGASAGATFNVGYVGPNVPVDYEIRVEKDWNHYSKKTRFPALRDNHFIKVRPDWLSTVRRIGTPSVAGCLILDATPAVVSEDGERSIWRAIVATQGRGFSVNVEERILSCWGHGVITVFRSEKAAMSENPPAQILEIVRREAAARELDKLTAEDLDALQGLAA